MTFFLFSSDESVIKTSLDLLHLKDKIIFADISRFSIYWETIFGRFLYINEQKLYYPAIVLFQMTFFLFNSDDFVIKISLDQLHHEELEVICRYKSIFYTFFLKFLVIFGI